MFWKSKSSATLAELAIGARRRVEIAIDAETQKEFEDLTHLYTDLVRTVMARREEVARITGWPVYVWARSVYMLLRSNSYDNGNNSWYIDLYSGQLYEVTGGFPRNRFGELTLNRAGRKQKVRSLGPAESQYGGTGNWSVNKLVRADIETLERILSSLKA
jgi:hypothetical protein